jgi:hypothetical protein
VHFGKTRGFSKDRDMPLYLFRSPISRIRPRRTLGSVSDSSAGCKASTAIASHGPSDHSRSKTFTGRRRTPASLLTITRTATSQVGVTGITPSRREPRRYRASIGSVHRSNGAEPGVSRLCQPSPSCHLRASGPGVRRSRYREGARLPAFGQKALRPHCRVAHSDAVLPSLISFASLSITVACLI